MKAYVQLAINGYDYQEMFVYLSGFIALVIAESFGLLTREESVPAVQKKKKKNISSNQTLGSNESGKGLVTIYLPFSEDYLNDCYYSFSYFSIIIPFCNSLSSK